MFNSHPEPGSKARVEPEFTRLRALSFGSLSCPFCKALGRDPLQAVVRPLLGLVPREYQVVCLDCDSSGPSANTPDKARAWWSAIDVRGEFAQL